MSTTKQVLEFKIRRKSDGLFSNGGVSPSFTKSGKTWTNRGGLTQHLTIVDNRSGYGKQGRVYDGCEVVEVEVTRLEVGTSSVQNYLNVLGEKKKEKQRKVEASSKRERERRERAELTRLKARYPE